MGIHDNKRALERFDRLAEGCEAEQLDQICTPDMTNHALALHRPAGLEGTKEFLRECRGDPGRAAWMRTMVGQGELVTIAEGDYVIQFGKRAGRWPGGQFRGFDIPAGDYEYDVAFMYRFEDGRIAERWALRDDLAMITQLSGISRPAPDAQAPRRDRVGRHRKIDDLAGVGAMIATSAPTIAVEQLQARVSALLASHLEVQVPRLGWDRERVRAHQRERLRGLLAHALARSPFHTRRLAGIDPERFELADLAGLPVMSKAQMMDGFDELLTDRRITRGEVEAHLARSRDEPRLLFDRYVCLASGGSSGLRGIFVQTLDEWTQFVASLARGPIAAITASGGLPSAGVQIGQVGAGSPVHSSGFGAATVTGVPLRFVSAPATLPLAEIVDRLNAADPPALQGYPSVLRQLAGERSAGRLRIAPGSVTSLGETLTAEDRQAIAAGFGVAVSDLFVSTEGLVGRSQPGEEVLTFASDLCIVELVDQQNQPVEPGSPSAKVLLTNLHNLTQPLIRYELTDRLIAQPAAPTDGHLRATVQGRADTPFRYGSIELSPFAIRSVFATAPTVREYQIRQTARGLEALIVAEQEPQRDALATRLEETLRTAGIQDPEVTVRRVDTIECHAQTGKTRRLIPITGDPGR